ncbi:hypothetical protein BHE74_00020828 [Ensete ventricosum]|nr:hypothetical protein GW17_00046040 [Ensete ventricosum]RWW71430.1 hypothetical protein BHE74_00020828 [Ensete ventricosum]
MGHRGRGDGKQRRLEERAVVVGSGATWCGLREKERRWQGLPATMARRRGTEMAGGGRGGQGRGQRRREAVVGGNGEADVVVAGISEER